MSDPSFWRLIGFDERLDWWIRDTDPPQDLVLLVLVWVMSRADDPFRGMRRVEGFDNLWFGMVPNTSDGKFVVTCSYWVDVAPREVRCDLISSSGWPA